jgi:D-glycero-alpha-D-manno-heptose 1-phosphate guanylyltransferase
MNIPALILAGGMGTRLKNIITDVPKPMAPVDNKPFLEHLLKYVSAFGINRFILSVGYKKESIIRHFGLHFGNSKIIYAPEEKPLGTGGALKNALNFFSDKKFLVLNGDTWFAMNYATFLGKTSKFTCAMAIRKESNKNRYGSVVLDDKFRITGFHEKNEASISDWMNAGVYLFDRTVLLSHFPAEEAFSLEKDVLPNMARMGDLFGIPMDGDFIDIGIPEDYERAKKIIPNSEYS